MALNGPSIQCTVRVRAASGLGDGTGQQLQQSPSLLRHTIRKMVVELHSVAYPGIFFGGGSTNSVEDRENGDLGVVAP